MYKHPKLPIAMQKSVKDLEIYCMNRFLHLSHVFVCSVSVKHNTFQCVLTLTHTQNNVILSDYNIILSDRYLILDTIMSAQVSEVR